MLLFLNEYLYNGTGTLTGSTHFAMSLKRVLLWSCKKGLAAVMHFDLIIFAAGLTRKYKLYDSRTRWYNAAKAQSSMTCFYNLLHTMIIIVLSMPQMQFEPAKIISIEFELSLLCWKIKYLFTVYFYTIFCKNYFMHIIS